MIAEGLSNREIAERLFLSPETIKWYNRQIYAKLGVHSRTQALVEADEQKLLANPAPAVLKIQGEGHGLPYHLTSFVGRQSQLAEVREMITDSRLVTLTGPGGTGKTRLAIEAARGVAQHFSDGVVFVDLAPIRDARLVPEAMLSGLGVAGAAGLTPTDALAHFLAPLHLLLLIDNFEHVIEAAPLLTRLLQETPATSILATSREPLHVSGERLYDVPPLALPGRDDQAPELIVEPSEAMTLFAKRAAAADASFELGMQNALAVANICRRLDGLPLAIELAAARTRLYSADVVLAQIQQEPASLSHTYRDMPERQNTIWSTMAWSYNLLPEPEKVLFARLSVFQGGRTIQAVEQVCSEALTIDILDGLESLVDKSLLDISEPSTDEPRFEFLETIHAFASEVLRERGEADHIRDRHAAYFVELVERAAPHLRGGALQVAWMMKLERELANLQEALTWTFGGGNLEAGLKLVAGLGHFWYRQGHWREGEKWVGIAMKHVADVPEDLRAGIYYSAGVASRTPHARQQAHEMFHKATALYREMGADRALGWSEIHLAEEAIGVEEDYREAVAICEQGMALLREAGDMAGVAQAYNIIGELARAAGFPARAEAAYAEALEIAMRQGDRLRQAMNMCNLAFLALDEGDADRAKGLVVGALELNIEAGSRYQTICTLAGLSGPLAALGAYDQSARLLGASDHLFERYRLAPQLGDQIAFDAYRETIKESMAESAYTAAYQAGRSMTLEQAVSLARGWADN